MSSLHRTQIYLEDAQIAALDARAKSLGVTRSDLIRSMIDQGLAANDGKPSLYDTLMRLGPAPYEPSLSREAFEQRRKKFEGEFEARLAAQRGSEAE